MRSVTVRMCGYPLLFQSPLPMTESDFRHTPLSRVGSWLHWLLGPSVTTITQGPSKTRTLSLRTDQAGDWPRATLTCARLVYRTQYKRWWVPNTMQSLYEVSIEVTAEVMARYGAACFPTMTYPPLCNHLLQWTTYPHLCAILTYLDDLIPRMHDINRRLRSNP